MNADPRTVILDQLREAFEIASNGRAKLNKVHESAHIIEEVGLYSLDLLELRYEIEERWNLRIENAEAFRLRTVGDVIDLILAKQQS